MLHGKGALPYAFGEHKNCKQIKEKGLPLPSIESGLDFVSENQNITYLSVRACPWFLLSFFFFLEWTLNKTSLPVFFPDV